MPGRNSPLDPLPDCIGIFDLEERGNQRPFSGERRGRGMSRNRDENDKKPQIILVTTPFRLKRHYECYKLCECLLRTHPWPLFYDRECIK